VAQRRLGRETMELDVELWRYMQLVIARSSPLLVEAQSRPQPDSDIADAHCTGHTRLHRPSVHVSPM
jgi:hypothetical protein